MRQLGEKKETTEAAGGASRRQASTAAVGVSATARRGGSIKAGLARRDGSAVQGSSKQDNDERERSCQWQQRGSRRQGITSAREPTWKLKTRLKTF